MHTIAMVDWIAAEATINRLLSTAPNNNISNMNNYRVIIIRVLFVRSHNQV